MFALLWFVEGHRVRCEYVAHPVFDVGPRGLLCGDCVLGFVECLCACLLCLCDIVDCWCIVGVDVVYCVMTRRGVWCGVVVLGEGGDVVEYWL